MKALITTSGAGGGAGVTHLFPESPGSTGSVGGTWAPFDVIMSPLSRDAEGLRRSGGARAGLEHQCWNTSAIRVRCSAQGRQQGLMGTAWILSPTGRDLSRHPGLLLQPSPLLSPLLLPLDTMGEGEDRDGHLPRGLGAAENMPRALWDYPKGEDCPRQDKHDSIQPVHRVTGSPCNTWKPHKEKPRYFPLGAPGEREARPSFSRKFCHFEILPKAYG